MNFTEYNPLMFELARHSRGYSFAELEGRSGIKAKRLSLIERGEDEPTREEAEAVGRSLDYPIEFFRQYPCTRLSFELRRSVPINYMAYRVIRLKNNNLKPVS